MTFLASGVEDHPREVIIADFMLGLALALSLQTTVTYSGFTWLRRGSQLAGQMEERRGTQWWNDFLSQEKAAHLNKKWKEMK